MKRLYSVILGVLSIVLLTVVFCREKQSAAVAVRAKTAGPDFWVSYENAVVYPWEREGKLFFFLPSYFDLEKTRLVTESGKLLLEEGQTEAGPLSELACEQPHFYRLQKKDETTSGQFCYYQSARVGSVFLDTESGSMEWVDQDKEYREGGHIEIRDVQGNTEYSGRMDALKSRGNASWQSDKKSYKLKLGVPADLFGMGEEKDWILLGNVYG